MYSYKMAPHIILLNKPRWRKKIAAFDYDWTLVKPLNGRTHAKDVNDHQWLRSSVPEMLKDIYKKGYAIMVFTNQTKVWKEEAIKNKLNELELPITVAIGFDEIDRKPHSTMWDSIIGAREWDLKKSYFVGDAAGREGDWSDSDAMFAKAVGVKFKTPEDVFPFDERVMSDKVVIEEPGPGREAIVMVGYPGSGKSTLSIDRFPNYERIVGDTLKTAERMVKKADAAGESSVIFDATNPDTARRAPYIAWAKQNNIPIRAIWFDMSIDNAMESSKRRESEGGPHIPRIAFYTFRKRFQEPSTEEGFDSILKI